MTSKSGKDEKNPDALTLWHEPGVSKEAMLARHAISPEFSGVSTVRAYAGPQWGRDNLHVTELSAALLRDVKAVQGGDLSGAEGMLMTQANSLNAIFNLLAQRASLNFGECLDAAERYLRLALKAQTQCRATIETLAAVKNPPIVYARQANVTTGPQQINNGAIPARETEIGRNEQSGDRHELLPDARAPGIESGINTTLAAVGEVNGAKVERRQGQVGPQCL